MLEELLSDEVNLLNAIECLVPFEDFLFKRQILYENSSSEIIIFRSILDTTLLLDLCEKSIGFMYSKKQSVRFDRIFEYIICLIILKLIIDIIRPRVIGQTKESVKIKIVLTSNYNKPSLNVNIKLFTTDLNDIYNKLNEKFMPYLLHSEHDESYVGVFSENFFGLQINRQHP